MVIARSGYIVPRVVAKICHLLPPLYHYCVAHDPHTVHASLHGSSSPFQCDIPAESYLTSAEMSRFGLDFCDIPAEKMKPPPKYHISGLISVIFRRKK